MNAALYWTDGMVKQLLETLWVFETPTFNSLHLQIKDTYAHHTRLTLNTPHRVLYAFRRVQMKQFNDKWSQTFINYFSFITFVRSNLLFFFFFFFFFVSFSLGSLTHFYFFSTIFTQHSHSIRAAWVIPRPRITSKIRVIVHSCHNIGIGNICLVNVDAYEINAFYSYEHWAYVIKRSNQKMWKWRTRTGRTLQKMI